jgi:2-deoxy-D-gluconate 3-dehydrogenase
MSSPPRTPASIAELVSLRGRAAIVTGSAMGIGRAIAERLHEAGAALVIADLDNELGAAVVDELNARRLGSATFVHVDVGVQDEVEAMIAAAVEHFGALDVLVNSAGIYPWTMFMDLDAEVVERVLRVNVVGLFLAMHAAARQMIAQGSGGRIINITSIDAINPSVPGLSHYDASKHGAWGFTKGAALELAEHGITVNALAPGAVLSPGALKDAPEAIERMGRRIPMGRMADPDEMARVAVFLASDLASYLTGSQVVVDGGLTLTGPSRP